MVSHLDGIKSILVVYPAAVAGGYTVVPGDGTAHFGLVVNVDDPPSCRAGYGGTRIRKPSETGATTVNTSAHCALPRGSVTSVRGAQNAPGGDPITSGGGGTVFPRAATRPAVVQLGGSMAQAGLLADNSWLPLLTGGLR
jgi:phospholipid/cholesterol/gamma-HCH transport system substrate-binding protein